MADLRVVHAIGCGQVFGRGENGYGELGVGHLDAIGKPELLCGHHVDILLGDSSSHNLVLTYDGDVFAWGPSKWGNCGRGPEDVHEPTLISELAPVKVAGLAAGGAHSLFYTDEGEIYCCGRNTSGELGLGDVSKYYYFAPQRLPHLSVACVRAVAAGEYHSLALTESGHVYGFGSNAYGQLDEGEAVSATLIDFTKPRTTVLDGNKLRAGKLLVAFTLPDGATRANDSSAPWIGLVQCGTEDILCGGDAWYRAHADRAGGLKWDAAYLPEEGKYDMIMVESGASAAIARVPIVVKGKLEGGVKTPMIFKTVAGIGKATLIACGSHHSLIVMDSGELMGCGKGHGSGVARVPLPSSSPINLLAGGGDHTLVCSELKECFVYKDVASVTTITVPCRPRHVSVYGSDKTPLKAYVTSEDGEVYTAADTELEPVSLGAFQHHVMSTMCSAKGAHAVTAAGSLVDLEDLTRNGVLYGRQTKELSLGGYSGAVLTEDGQIFVFGDNAHGQLVTGDRVKRERPAPVTAPDYDGGWKHVAMGYNHLVCAAEDGEVWVSASCTLERLRGLSGKQVKSVAAGYLFSVALTEDGQAYTWGDNTYGQLGLGDTEKRATPELVVCGNGERVVHVSAAWYHTMFISEAGSLLTCGNGKHGALGHGGTSTETSPRIVHGLYEEVVSVSGCEKHSAVVTKSGRLWAFGCGSAYVTGKQTPEIHSTPVLIPIAEEDGEDTGIHFDFAAPPHDPVIISIEDVRRRGRVRVTFTLPPGSVLAEDSTAPWMGFVPPSTTSLHASNAWYRCNESSSGGFAWKAKYIPPPGMYDMVLNDNTDVVARIPVCVASQYVAVEDVPPLLIDFTSDGVVTIPMERIQRSELSMTFTPPAGLELCEDSSSPWVGLVQPGTSDIVCGGDAWYRLYQRRCSGLEWKAQYLPPPGNYEMIVHDNSEVVARARVTIQARQPVAVPSPGVHIVAVSTGMKHTCAVSACGTMYGLGQNEWAQLQPEDKDSRKVFAKASAIRRPELGVRYLSVAADRYSTLNVTSGRVKLVPTLGSTEGHKVFVSAYSYLFGQPTSVPLVGADGQAAPALVALVKSSGVTHYDVAQCENEHATVLTFPSWSDAKSVSAALGLSVEHTPSSGGLWFGGGLAPADLLSSESAPLAIDVVHVVLSRACALCIHPVDNEFALDTSLLTAGVRATSPCVREDVLAEGATSLVVCSTCALRVAEARGFANERACRIHGQACFNNIVNQFMRTGELYTDSVWAPHDSMWTKVRGALRVGDPAFISYPKSHNRVTSVVANPMLYHGGIDAADVEQGAIGTCYLLGSIAVLANQPGLVENVFVDSDFSAGVVVTRFSRDGKWSPIVVDDWIPCAPTALSAASPLFGWSPERSELFVMFLEKSYAKFKGSWESIDGGIDRYAMVDLTGGICEMMEFENPKVARRLETGSMFRDVEDFIRGGKLLSCYIIDNTVASEHLRDDGLLCGHAYGVIGTYIANREPLMKLRNPHGRGEFNGAWSDTSALWETIPMEERKVLSVGEYGADDGVFFMSFSDFSTIFTAMDVTTPPQQGITGDSLKFLCGSLEVDAAAQPAVHIQVTSPGTRVAVELIQQTDSLFGAEVALLLCEWRLGSHYYIASPGTRSEQTVLSLDWRTAKVIDRVFPSNEIKVSCVAELSPDPAVGYFVVASATDRKTPMPATLSVRADRSQVAIRRAVLAGESPSEDEDTYSTEEGEGDLDDRCDDDHPPSAQDGTEGATQTINQAAKSNVRRAKSQGVRRAKSQGVRRAKSQGVRRAKSQGVRRAKSKAVRRGAPSSRDAAAPAVLAELAHLRAQLEQANARLEQANAQLLAANLPLPE